MLPLPSSTRSHSSDNLSGSPQPLLLLLAGRLRTTVARRSLMLILSTIRFRPLMAWHAALAADLGLLLLTEGRSLALLVQLNRAEPHSRKELNLDLRDGRRSESVPLLTMVVTVSGRVLSATSSTPSGTDWQGCPSTRLIQLSSAARKPLDYGVDPVELHAQPSAPQLRRVTGGVSRAGLLRCVGRARMDMLRGWLWPTTVLMQESSQ